MSLVKQLLAGLQLPVMRVLPISGSQQYMVKLICQSSCRPRALIASHKGPGASMIVCLLCSSLSVYCYIVLEAPRLYLQDDIASVRANPF